MAFGVLYDFTGNSNASIVTPATKMIAQQWFLDAVNYTQPIDMFVVLGHNPAGRNGTGSTLPLIYQAIRKIHADTPITLFAGHLHVRDTMVFDNKAVSIASGRYCETLGWLSISGFNQSSYKAKTPTSVLNPSQAAVVMTNGSAAANLSLSKTPSSLKYFRRYLDWNRFTMEYHANGSQTTFDYQQGKAVTAEVTAERQQLNLTALIGCAPKTWCMTCKPFGDPGNIFTGLLQDALAYTVVNSSRSSNPRLILINTGSVRFDLPEGPFTLDDSYIVSPFTDAFQYLANVPYSNASKVLGIMNAGPFQKKRDLSYNDFNFQPMLGQRIIETCQNPAIPSDINLVRRSPTAYLSKVKRATAVSPGYTTSDDFGTDGDDTVHSKIPSYNQPNDLQANASFPTDGSTPKTVDLIFLDFIAPNVLSALNQTGLVYKISDVQYYLPPSFTTNSYLPIYAKAKWQAGIPNCPIGGGIGS
jgi:NAD nucleotidase-like protein